ITGGPNLVIARHADLHVKMTEIVIKFLYALVVMLVPAVNIVVYGNVGIKVSDTEGAGVHLPGAYMRGFVERVRIGNIKMDGLRWRDGWHLDGHVGAVDGPLFGILVLVIDT